MYVIGIDVSRHNGKIDHRKAAAAGAKYVFIRCTVGDYYTDPRFAENWYGFKEAGLLVSAYIVPIPSAWNGRPIPYKDQVDKFLHSFQDRQPDMPIAIDAEVDMGKDRTFLTALFEGTGRLLQDFGGFPYPYIYTRKTWWDLHINAAKFWKNYPLWVAHYTNAPQPWLPRDWKEWSGWQYSSKGKGPFFGDEEDYIDLNHMQPEDFLKYTDETPGQNLYPVSIEIGSEVYKGKLEKLVQTQFQTAQHPLLGTKEGKEGTR